MIYFYLFIGSILSVLKASTLTCPSGTEQVGGLNEDIGGCGLEGCDARYQDRYKSIDDCRNGCNSRADCASFTWAPLNGDKNHPGKTVCTLYNDDRPNQKWGPQQIMCRLLSCPPGTDQVGGLNADIGGCGIEGCNKRYQDRYKSITDCRDGCKSCPDCNSFTWAPLNGDRNHPGKTVCTLYKGTTPNQQWSPNQIMCKRLQCPPNSRQIGGLNADIGGCGLEGCDARYNKQNIGECEAHCLANYQCKSYTWAPLDGDRNHPGKTVCTIYNTDKQNQLWSPNQILCQPNSRATSYSAYYDHYVNNEPVEDYNYGDYVIEVNNPYFIGFIIFALVLVLVINLICCIYQNTNNNKSTNKYKKVSFHSGIDSDTDINESKQLKI